MLLSASDTAAPAAGRPELYVMSRGERAESEALRLAIQLRRAGRWVEVDLSGSGFGKQFKRADRSGATWAVVIGESEMEQEQVILKNLKAEIEERIPAGELLLRFA